jgi:hypothetical protein
MFPFIRLCLTMVKQIFVNNVKTVLRFNFLNVFE